MTIGAADNKDPAVVEQRGRVVRAGAFQVARRGPGVLARIVDLGGRQERRIVLLAADDEDATVTQGRRRVFRAWCGGSRGCAPRIRGRIEDRGIRNWPAG